MAERDARSQKAAFALCARGERFERYRDNLVKSLRRYVPGADIVDIDVEKAESILPKVSDKRRSIQMSRLAIPLMEEFRNYDRVVWIDVDTDVVSDKFAGIMDVETGPDGLAAVEDIYQDSYRKRMEERYPGYEKKKYFNSGVLVIDICKIDADDWRKRAEEGIMEHARNPFRSPDQDLLNRYFDITPIDKRYNWIWRRGADAVKGAWLVHYTDNEGHKMLDELIETRRGESTERKSQDGRMVAVCPRHGLVVPWIRSYFSSGNTIPLAIVEDPDGSWTENDAEYCRKASEFCGGKVVRFEGGRDKNLIMAHIAKTIGPKSWAWIDDTAEVSGNLDECFDFAEERPGFICVQFYYKGNVAPDSIDSMHPLEFGLKPGLGGKICETAFLIFHGDANDRLQDLAGDLPAKGDDAFGYLYQTSDAWHEGFFDMSIRNWQEDVRNESDMSGSWSGKIINYLPGKFIRHLESKASSMFPAQFERKERDGSEDEDDGAVDAVFVIGTGSVDNNEELRYALRNLENHCKFVRNVYISGFCPTLVDKSSVIHLNWPDRFSHAKDANIIDKLRHACEHKGIAKRILFCSDDQFQTRECSWEDFRPRYLRRYASNDTWYEDRKRVWHTRLRNTLEREVKRRISLGMDANEVFYYQPHIWMAIDRDKFIEYARWSNYEKRTDTIIASGYYNFAGAEGVPDFDHEFMGANGDRWPKATHVAYHDGSEKAAMRVLKAMFPSRSRFEIQEKTVPKRSPMPAARKAPPAKAEYRMPEEDPSPATAEELAELHDVMRQVRDRPSYVPLLGEISRAEELRLFGVRGWRTVWRDIVRRWRLATKDGEEEAREVEKRSEKASDIVSRYMSDPESMRTVRFSQDATERYVPSFGRQLPRPASASVIGSLRNKVMSLRNRIK